MDRRKKKKQVKKNYLISFFRGEFLYKDARKHFPYILYLLLLVLVVIRCNHNVSDKIKKINQLKTEVEQYKSQDAYIQSKLIKIKLESELSKEVVQDSLKALETHPIKILVKAE